MIDRIRDLLDRPVDQRHAEAIVALAALVTFAFGVLIALGIVGHNPGADAPLSSRTILTRPTAPAGPGAEPANPTAAAGRETPDPTQDPQDRKGSGAYRRARRATDSHRAMQHLPYRIGRASLAIVGADRGRAVIRVTAPSIAAGHRAWRAFLRRFEDDGGAYVTRFEVGARNGITRRRDAAGPGALGAAGPDGSSRRRHRVVRHHRRDSGDRASLRSIPHPKPSP